MILYAPRSAAKRWSQPSLKPSLKPLLLSGALCCGYIHQCLAAGLMPGESLGAGLGCRETHRPWLLLAATDAVPLQGQWVQCPRGPLHSPCLASQGAAVFLPPARISPTQHRWVLSSLFGCSITTSLVCLSLPGPRSVVFLKAVNQVRNNSFFLAK